MARCETLECGLRVVERRWAHNAQANIYNWLRWEHFFFNAWEMEIDWNRFTHGLRPINARVTLLAKSIYKVILCIPCCTREAYIPTWDQTLCCCRFLSLRKGTMTLWRKKHFQCYYFFFGYRNKNCFTTPFGLCKRELISASVNLHCHLALGLDVTFIC